MRRISLSIVLLAGAADASTTPLRAADLAPVTAPQLPPAPENWNGFYAGGHAGYGFGRAPTSLVDPVMLTQDKPLGTALGGVQGGLNHVFGHGLLIGAEADLTFSAYLDSNPLLAHYWTPSGDELREQVDYFGTLRGRIGQVYGPMLFYGTGGVAFMGARVINNLGSGGSEKALISRTGWVAGGGVEYALAPRWTARAEYLYSSFGATSATLPWSGAQYGGSATFSELRVGLNRQLGGPDAPAMTPVAPADGPLGGERWELHAQSTYIAQGYPSFQAPYSGPNSLSPQSQIANTFSTSAFAGVRLWDGGAAYFTPELFQGYGLGGTTGLGGFSNGEAQKSNFPYPRFTPTRAIVRQTFGLGGEQESLDSGPQQLAEKVDVSRVTVQVGRMSVLDVFDGNSYAKDPRKDFMNWSVWGPGAFDYGADKVGLTWGATAELNQKQWALRLGYFLMDSSSNVNTYDMNIGARGEYVAELEERWSLNSHVGKVRFLAFLNSVYAGSYGDTLADPALNLDITQTRQSRLKYGYGINVEQALTDDIGVFGRWSWNDGHTEIMAFTDIDRSLSFGTSVRGNLWGRKDDTIGVAYAINGLSRDHRDFLAAGGIGVLVGDGALPHPGDEQIIEAYYAFRPLGWASMTVDYQHIANPGYNRDRGPANVVALRLHAGL